MQRVARGFLARCRVRRVKAHIYKVLRRIFDCTVLHYTACTMQLHCLVCDPCLCVCGVHAPPAIMPRHSDRHTSLLCRV
jgi:hypothetical protein